MTQTDKPRSKPKGRFQLPEGAKVIYDHAYTLSTPQGHTLGEQHRATAATVYDAEENIIATGLAVCHPNDQFSKRIGRNIARGRALKRLSE
jgi:hypothetical protein